MTRFAVSVVFIALAFTASASAASRHYSGKFDGEVTSEFSFDLVKKKGKRMVKHVKFTGLPVFCDTGQLNTSNGSSPVTARVGSNQRFAATRYKEYPGGFVDLAHLRGEFRQRRAISTGRFSMTSRGLGAEGFVDCSSGFVDFTVERAGAQ